MSETCVGCEGKPAPENNPCAVCGATNTQPTPVAEVSPEMLRRQEVCPLCEGKQMEPGFFCIAHCRDGVVLWTTANTLRNIKPWLEGDKQRRTALADAERKLEEALAAFQNPTPAMLNAAVDATGAGSGMSWSNMSPQRLFEKGARAMARAFLAQDGGKA